MPALLLLVSRDLLLFDPPRVLAWRVLHEAKLALLPAALMPRLPAGVDRDPVALVLAALASGLALAYLAAGLLGATARLRAMLLAAAAAVVVAVPTVAVMAMGAALERPYGQDGGVVQLPLAMEKIARGESPYGADYSATILGRQARVSGFWAEHGGNPILRHHAYLPGTHLLMAPVWWPLRAAGFFDPRMVTLLAWAVAVLLATRLVEGDERRLAAAAAIAVNPLLYWQQIFGANDILIVALVLTFARLALTGRPTLAAAVLGLACATKQLAWPFAPFLLLFLSGARSLPELVRGPARGALLRAAAVAAAVFLAVVVPVAALDPHAFWGDIVAYNVGLPGADAYPLGGTPGLGFANFLVAYSKVESLRDHVPFSRFYLLLVPLGVLLVRRQLRLGGMAAALLAGSAALVLSLYFSRVVHPNYLILAAALVPIALLMDERWPADVGLVPLALFATAVEVAENEVFRALWEDAVAARLPGHLGGIAGALMPTAGPHLSLDPMGLVVSATAAGFGVALLVAGVLGAPRALRMAVVVAAAACVLVAPTLFAMRVGEAAGHVRAQDRWAPGLGTRPAVEAWSASFRRDPPAAITVEAGPSPGTIAGAALLRRAGIRDARAVALVAAVALAALAAALVAPVARVAAAGLLLLAPPMVTGTAFGAGDTVLAVTLLLLWELMRRGRPWLVAVMAGLAATVFPRAFSAVPALVLVHGVPAAAAASATLFTALTVAGALAFVRQAIALPVFDGLAPGIGLVNLLLVTGRGQGRVLWGLAVMVAAVLVVRATPRPAWDPGRLAAAGAAVLGWCWITPGASPHDLLVPMALPVLALLIEGQDR